MTHRPFGEPVPAYPRRCQNQRSTLYEPCVALDARLEAAQFGAERLAGDGAVADREILRRACRCRRTEPSAGEQARGLGGGTSIRSLAVV